MGGIIMGKLDFDWGFVKEVCEFVKKIVVDV